MAQLIEWLLPILEVHCSNPVIGKIFIEHFTVNCIEKTKIKEKEAGNDHLKNILEKLICSLTPRYWPSTKICGNAGPLFPILWLRSCWLSFDMKTSLSSTLMSIVRKICLTLTQRLNVSRMTPNVVKYKITFPLSRSIRCWNLKRKKLVTATCLLPHFPQTTRAK